MDQWWPNGEPSAIDGSSKEPFNITAIFSTFSYDVSHTTFLPSIYMFTMRGWSMFNSTHLMGVGRTDCKVVLMWSLQPAIYLARGYLRLVTAYYALRHKVGIIKRSAVPRDP